MSRLAIVFLGLVCITARADQKIIIAHRGASGYVPEHTLEAVAMAHAMGADYIEPDVVISKDGVPVVLHDIHLESVTDVAARFPDRKRSDGKYYALDFTLKELKELRVLERFDPKTQKPVYPKRFPLGKASFQIPTLQEEIELVQGLNHSTGRKAGIYPEIKAPAWHRKQGVDTSKIILAVLHQYGYKTRQDPCFLQCFEFEEVKRLRTELGWKGNLVQLTGANEELLKPEGLKEVAKYADGIGPPLGVIVTGKTVEDRKVTDFVKQAHAAGLKVHPYTIRTDVLPKYARDGKDMFQIFLREANVDGVFTDFPDEGANYLKSR